MDMSKRFTYFFCISALILAAIFVFLHLPIQRDDLFDSIEYTIDRLVESGIFWEGIDYDDPLLVEQRTIIITEAINERVSKEVAGKLLYLNNLDPEEPIDLYVKTMGGWQDDAFLICDIMELIDAPVNTWSTGASYSAGAIILAAGTGTRTAMPNTLIMIHTLDEPGVIEYSYNYKSRSRMEQFWRTKADLPEHFYPMDIEKEYFFTPEEALEYNIIDRIGP